MKRPISTAVTRRDLAAVLAALPLVAAPAANPQTQTAPQDELAAARQRTQQTIDQLRRFKVPIATEPSFAFRP
jgi:hypothetical protein